MSRGDLISRFSVLAMSGDFEGAVDMVIDRGVSEKRTRGYLFPVL